MEKPVTGTVVEGIDDSIVYGFIIFSALLILVIFLLMRSSRPNQTIHPESADNVYGTRQRLQQQNRHVSTRRNAEAVTCPVCIGDTNYAVETNCGHIFCGSCIITYWQYGSWMGAIRCPVCRQPVTILLLCFTDEETNNDTEERNNVIRDIHSYNRRFSGEPRDWMDYVRDLPTLLRHAFREFFSWNGLVWIFQIRIFLCFVGAIVYFISPLDIIPEGVVGILGFFDDLFIIFMLAIYVSIIYRRMVEERANAGFQAS